MKSITIAALISVAALAGCGTVPVVNETQQPIAFSVTPAAAVCTGSRQGVGLLSITGGSATVTVSKSRNPIVLDCAAPGYLPTRQVIDSSRGDVSFSPLWDYVSGGLNKYPDAVWVALRPAPSR